MVDGQRQSCYGPTRADALAGPERAANHDHRQAAARDGATVADFAAEWLAAARQTVRGSEATWTILSRGDAARLLRAAGQDGKCLRHPENTIGPAHGGT
jgi:hypothetical protein